MSIKNQETIADIVAEMLEFADTDSQTIGRDVLRRRIQHFARRFETAAKREREAGADAAQICGEIGEMIVKEATREKSSQVGNAAKMREALGEISREIWESIDPFCNDDCCKPKRDLAKIADAALASPPRNCDIGTALDQVSRHGRRCAIVDHCEVNCRVCFAKWAQMPYEEAKGEMK